MHSEQWVIYDHPKDYPNNFVVRRWENYEGLPVPSQVGILVTSIEEARDWIPTGFVKTLPMPDDDPVIVEVWV